MRIFLPLLVFFLVGCKAKVTEPSLYHGRADVSNVVYIGDSYLSGYQDGALFRDGQRRSVGALISRSFEQLDGSVIHQPLLSDGSVGYNSKLWVSELQSQSHLMDSVQDCKGEYGLKPVKTTFNYSSSDTYVSYDGAGGAVNDFSVPFARMQDLFESSLGDDFATGGNLFYHRFATNNQSVMESVQGMSPSFSAIWVGMEDVFRYCQSGGADPSVDLPSVGDFEMYLDSVLSMSVGASEQGVIANIPDFSVFPYYTLVQYNGADLTLNQADSLNDAWHLGGFSHINFEQGTNPFVIADATHSMTYRQMKEGEYITLSIPIDSLKCYYMGLLGSAIPDQYSLDSLEVDYIRQKVDGYNQIISNKASEYGIALVDLKTYFDEVNSGVQYLGVDVSTEFVSGGFISLDGFHLTQKGAAMVASEFLKAINEHYVSDFPIDPCFDCNGVLFP